MNAFDEQSLPGPAYLPISDYAVIGDCRCAALISTTGSIDWLCLPRFDSPSIFAALLDRAKGGRFSIRPTQPFRARRRYIDDTNVLETTFTTEAGVIQLIDLMPIYTDEDRRRKLTPERELVRLVECLDGRVEVEVYFEPRPNYARQIPDLKRRGNLGIFSEHGDHVVVLGSDVTLAISADRLSATGRFFLQKGESRSFSLSFSQEEPAVIPVLGDETRKKIQRSIEWWKGWASKCSYEGPYRDAVVRSVLTLKLMRYAPSGAIVAAPTTSLPERIGGMRNWDYRYCWLRDASMTLRALFRLGYIHEGEAFLAWMLHSTRLRRPKLQIVHDVYGEVRLKEEEIEHFEGYMLSRPVRIGNGAAEQLQLDVYGEVIEAAYEYIEREGRVGAAEQEMLVGFGKAICDHWQEPDEGIWEIRGRPRHHVYSKVLCWVGLDKLLKLVEQGVLHAPVTRFAEIRDKLHKEIEKRGFNEKLQSYVTWYDGEDVDASLLLLPIYNYIDASAPRMKSTYAHIRETLGINGLIYRYRADFDGLPPGEGAFAISSFWAVQCRAFAGEVDAAARDFEQVLKYRNDVGLYAEEIDPPTGNALGNFPQAYTHVGLINAACTLAHEGKKKSDGK